MWGGVGVWQPQFQKWGKGDGGGGWGAEGGGKGNWNRKKVDPDTTIWIGKLPEGTEYQELKAHAEASGLTPVWAETYQFKGNGTGAIGFRTPEEAQRAIQSLNCSMLNGATIEADMFARKSTGGRNNWEDQSGWNDSVTDSWSWNNSATDSWKAARSAGNWNQQKVDHEKTIWVGGIPPGTTYQELKDHAEASGIRPVWADTYQHKGTGTGAIGFKTPEEAQSAILSLHGSMLKGATIQTDAWQKPEKTESESAAPESKLKIELRSDSLIPEETCVKSAAPESKLNIELRRD